MMEPCPFEYTCSECGQKFHGQLTPEQRKEQFHREFPGARWDPASQKIVCSNCFKHLMG